VAPRLVEEAIAEHVPGVAEVVVVGSPDPEWGEVVCALVVLEPGAVRAGLTAVELRAHLRGILPDHALPRRAATVTAVPTRGPGKPDRRAVAALFRVE
jgi:o-succinylbenzoate---CoA ligase